MDNKNSIYEMLGYPPDSRLLILNIDDYGMCYSANESAIEILKKGNASSCTIMMTCPWNLHAINMLKQNPEIQCGVHLTAISEHPAYRWGPLTPAEKVPTLTHDGKYFYSEKQIDEFVGKVALSELETEFRAQIDTAIKAGLKPTHFDSHCNIHDSRNDIFDMTVNLAREYGVALRVSSMKNIKKLKNQGFTVIDYPALDSFTLKTENKQELYSKMLLELPAGLSEWAIHPAKVSPELCAINEGWDVRNADYEFFSSDKVQNIIKKEGIFIIRYERLKRFLQ